MKAFKKKKELEDMLITHKLPKEQDKDKAGREVIEKGAEGAKSLKDLDQMKRRLASTSDQNEREMVLDMNQKQFGNETAERIVKELRLLKNYGGVSQSGESNSSNEKTKRLK